MIRTSKSHRINEWTHPATAIMAENHPKTFPEPLLIPMYASRANIAQKSIAGYGRPLRLVFLKIFGALPQIARPSEQCASVNVSIRNDQLVVGDNVHRARELVYKSLEAADQAEVKRAALMT